MAGRKAGEPRDKLGPEAAREALRLRDSGATLGAIIEAMDLDLSISGLSRALRAPGLVGDVPRPYDPDPGDGKAGARIRATREAAGVDRRGLAGALGVTYQRIADIEADRKPITLESILLVAGALGCDPHALDPRLAPRRPRAGGG